MLPTTTGDPTMDALMTWLAGGARLDAVGAMLGLAAFLRYMAIPGMTALVARLGYPLSASNKVLAIHGVGVVCAVLVGLVTHSGMTVLHEAFLGLAASNAAIGLHQTQEITAKATAARTDSQQLNATLTTLDTTDAVAD